MKATVPDSSVNIFNQGPVAQVSLKSSRMAPITGTSL